jgi:flagellar basal-body rod protein FlgB
MAINNLFGIYENTLSLRAKRSELLASNLVNADTPGYKAKDIDFSSMVKNIRENSGKMITTNKNHISEDSPIADFDIKYRIPLQASLDGNTVETNVENAQFADNAMRYMASVRFIDGKVKGILTALRGE